MHLIIKFDLIQTASLIYQLEKEILTGICRRNYLLLLIEYNRKNCKFTCEDFRNFDVSKLGNSDFVYVDPPYLITCATYNEQGGWSEQDEIDLLAFLDRLTERNLRFALSNVLRSKGKENKILIEWLQKNTERYNIHSLNYGYSNSNYQ